jgi:two-component system, NarL family, response regulator NreC
MAIKILLVDDHIILRGGIRVYLECNSNFEVVGEAGNGRQALEMVEALRPDVVVLDWVMPDMDGHEATLQIMNRFPETQVLILTLYDQSAYVQYAIDAGAYGFLLKEDIVEHLNKAIMTAMAGKKYFSPNLLSHIHLNEEEYGR